MAKRAQKKRQDKAALEAIFQKTQPRKAQGGDEVPATGRTMSVGVGLKESELHLLDRIAQELEVSRNALMRYALRYFLKAYRGGKIDPATDVETPAAKKRLKMP
ncbi:MAG: ribbon-helix-helix protein, CopG family [Anaerolineales bacterium]